MSCSARDCVPLGPVLRMEAFFLRPKIPGPLVRAAVNPPPRMGKVPVSRAIFARATLVLARALTVCLGIYLFHLM